MVRIIKGTYGNVVGKRVVRVTPQDDPITLTAEQEERLVKLGVAECVDNGRKTEEELLRMKMQELKEHAKEHGVKFNVGETKEDLARRILEAYEKPAGSQGGSGTETEGEDLEGLELEEDEIPSFDAEKAVQ